tara:strand:+ start:611 stop:1234 length:624 start_codon:yes stop_codon:yes gene_type:complete
MINAWSFLYDEMYGPDDEQNYAKRREQIENGEDSEYELTADGFVWPKVNDLPPTDQSTYIDEYPKPLSSMSDDKINFNVNDNMPPWGHSDLESSLGGSIDLNLDQLSTNGFWKYEEDLTMKEVREYLSSTYNAHYTSKDSKTQTLDLIESIGDAEPFCRSNAIKYLSRFGKKGGKSKQDILKAIHYCVLLYHFSGLHKQHKGNYETF